jgi:hypothetical protein
MQPFPHASFIRRIIPISDPSLGHFRQMMGKTVEDPLQELEKSGWRRPNAGEGPNERTRWIFGNSAE